MDEQEVRLSDAERDEIVEQLRIASSDGRITLDEFSERSRCDYFGNANPQTPSDC